MKKIQNGTSRVFLSKISSRHVSLLKTIPYQNKILLKLSSEQWIKPSNVTTLQPLAMDETLISSGEIRRAANTLLAHDYLESGKPVVHDIALKPLKQYVWMRDDLFSIMGMTSRVCIRALKTFARQGAESLDLCASTWDGSW